MIVQSIALRRMLPAFAVFVMISGCSGNSILDRIETYKAPPYPVSPGDLVDRETYDYRLKSGEPNPPSFTDSLICDLWQRMTMDLDLKGINQYRVSENDVQRAINVYVENDWHNISGYRPWTHSNFLRSLTTSERKRLDAEVVRYMAQYGVRDPS